MSIPTSLIVVVLVLAWLVVLVPMVARRREAVPEAEMAGGTFRVLRRSGEPARRRPSFRQRVSENDAEVETAAPDDVAGNQELDEELLDDEYDDTDEYDDEQDEYVQDGYDDARFDSAPAPAPTPVTAMSGRSSGRPAAGSHPYRPAERIPSGSHPYRPAASWVDGSDDHDDDAAYDNSAYHDAAYDDGPAQHEEDLHLRPIPRRAGRGGYDPDAAEVARQFKYSRRRRVTVVLLLATLLFSAAALLTSPVLWTGTAVFGLLLVGYLAYLRRQVQIETSIRERRLARLRRARQIRPEYDLDRADTPPSGSAFARNAVPASQVPPTGYRRGRQIVDLDDDDPSFDDLEYYQPLSYRRASGQ